METDELLCLFSRSVRMGITNDLPYLCRKIPGTVLWDTLLRLYARDCGIAPLATYVLERYTTATTESAYEVAWVLSQVPKSRMVNFAHTVFWKAWPHGPKRRPALELLGQVVGNLQSAYRYDWDPVTFYEMMRAMGRLGTPEAQKPVWEYLDSVSTILRSGSNTIRDNLLALRRMQELTGIREFFVLAVISVSQPGEWAGPIVPKVPPMAIPKKAPKVTREVVDLMDITTKRGVAMVRSCVESGIISGSEAITVGIRNYYNVSLCVTQERPNILVHILKKYARSIDTDPTNWDPETLWGRIRLLGIARKIPKLGTPPSVSQGVLLSTMRNLTLEPKKEPKKEPTKEPTKKVTDRRSVRREIIIGK